MAALLIGITMLCALGLSATALFKLGNEAVPGREREHHKAIRKHGLAKRVERPCYRKAL